MTVPAPPEPMMLAVFDGYLALSDDLLSSVTKLGGRPAFLPGRETGAAAEVLSKAVCGRCKGPMFLVAQCYCPLRDNKNRMMYVFACNKACCTVFPDDAWRAFTVQCDFEDPALDDEEAADLNRLPQPDGALKKTMFPPVATAIEEEPEGEEIEQTELEKRMQAQAEAQEAVDESAAATASDSDGEGKPQGPRKDKGDATRAELEELEEKVDLKNKQLDEYYEEFRSRVARLPQQVLRYQINGEPIFMNPERTIAAKIPPCRKCGGPQCMEMQIMPTAIFYLRAAACAPEGGSDGMDFATVTVYHCAKSCEADLPGVVVSEQTVFVEAPPTAADEKAARGGKMSFRETVTGEASPTVPPGAAGGPAAPPKKGK
eukprot:CAMPEP_0174848708 /NCGR_PEP_ID=MMETSP1114-20130205/13678_1 /TAXON_ID=312471 /ORGANISM="Neobodo designis, Strain CCAP 1951/1" /LENGTH=372 /DNA_ID=CAMNT_0016083013 /DNA_START=33 /DNA_END=1151 /DNA_ORIENTATION=+